MSSQPFPVSDSKEMYSNRLYTSNYDFSFSSNLSNINNNDLNKNKKISIGLNNNDSQKNYYNQSLSNNNTHNYMINSKNLSLNNSTNNGMNQVNNNNISMSQLNNKNNISMNQLNSNNICINQLNNNNICMNQQINKPLNRIQQNIYNQQSHMAKIKRNLPPNCKNHEIRLKSPQFKQNIPFYKNISLNSSTYDKNNNIEYQQKHLLSPKQNLTDRSSSKNKQYSSKNNQYSSKNNQYSSKNNELSSLKFEQFNLHYQNIINRRNSNSNKNFKKDTINQNISNSNKLNQLNNDKQNNKQNYSQKSSKKDKINHNNNINIQDLSKKPLNTSKIQKNAWHRKSKSIQFPPLDYKINQKQLFDQKQVDSLQQLKQRVKYMQNMIKDNIFSLQSQKIRIQRLQLSLQSQNQQKNDFINNILTSQTLKRPNNKHSRTNSSSSNNNYRQLSDIMSLIEQNKNYQIKNSDQYRKMIQQFRSTILEFRDQLNRTIKKEQLNQEVRKIKQLININIGNINNHKQIDIGKNIINQTNQNCIFSNSFIQKSILQLKQTINKLQDSNLSLKAQIAKINLKDKKSSQQNINKFQDIEKKINNVHNSLPIFDQRNCKRSDKKYEERSICFSVNQSIKKQITQSLNMSKHSIRRSNSTAQSQGSHLKFSHARSPSSNLADSGYKYNCNLYDSNIYEEKDRSVSKRIYYIDKQGYLLDKDNYYLLDTNNELIKLSDKEIQILKKLNVLQFTQSNY